MLRTWIRRALLAAAAAVFAGGAPGASAADPRGPDATGMMWSFFSASRPAAR